MGRDSTDAEAGGLREYEINHQISQNRKKSHIYEYPNIYWQ